MRGEFGVQSRLKSLQSHLMVTCSKAGIAGVCVCKGDVADFVTDRRARRVRSRKLHQWIVQSRIQDSHWQWSSSIDWKQFITKLVLEGRKSLDTQHSLMNSWMKRGVEPPLSRIWFQHARQWRGSQSWLFFVSFQLTDCAIYIYIRIHIYI